MDNNYYNIGNYLGHKRNKQNLCTSVGYRSHRQRLIYHPTNTAGETNHIHSMAHFRVFHAINNKKIPNMNI